MLGNRAVHKGQQKITSGYEDLNAQLKIQTINNMLPQLLVSAH